MPLDVMENHPTATNPPIQKAIEALRRHLETVFRALDLPIDCQVSLLLTGDDEIQRLNQQWRQIDTPTDVLSFPAYPPNALPEQAFHLGDIAISVPYAQRLVDSAEHRRRLADEAGVDEASFQWTLEDELSFLFLHGLLHLAGYDHGTAEEEAAMKAKEYQLWQVLTHD